MLYNIFENHVPKSPSNLPLVSRILDEMTSLRGNIDRGAFRIHGNPELQHNFLVMNKTPDSYTDAHLLSFTYSGITKRACEIMEITTDKITEGLDAHQLHSYCGIMKTIFREDLQEILKNSSESISVKDVIIYYLQRNEGDFFAAIADAGSFFRFFARTITTMGDIAGTYFTEYRAVHYNAVIDRLRLKKLTTSFIDKFQDPMIIGNNSAIYDEFGSEAILHQTNSVKLLSRIGTHYHGLFLISLLREFPSPITKMLGIGQVLDDIRPQGPLKSLTDLETVVELEELEGFLINESN